MPIIDSLQDLVYKNEVPFVIWCYWEGEPMKNNRLLSFEYLVKNIAVPVFLVTPQNLSALIKEDYPLNDSYSSLSIVHRSDYIRAYLLHHYGGGWHDIKATEVSFSKVWNEFEDPNIWIVGQPEIPNGAAKTYSDDGKYMPDFIKELIAIPSWVGRPSTDFSKSLLHGIEEVLNKNHDKLILNPAKHPREKKIISKNFLHRIFTKLKFLYQKRSLNYPIEWTLFGNIFHPCVLKYKSHVSKNLPINSVKNAGVYHRG